MDNDSIYELLGKLYQESQKRLRFFRRKTGLIKIIKFVDKVEKFNKGNKLVYWDDKKHTDESKKRIWIRFEILFDGERMHWDVRDHHLNIVRDYIGKTVDFTIENPGEWKKCILHMKEHPIDTDRKQFTIEKEQTNETKRNNRKGNTELPKATQEEPASSERPITERIIPEATETNQGSVDLPGKMIEADIEEPVSAPEEPQKDMKKEVASLLDLDAESPMELKGTVTSKSKELHYINPLEFIKAVMKAMFDNKDNDHNYRSLCWMLHANGYRDISTQATFKQNQDVMKPIILDMKELTDD